MSEDQRDQHDRDLPQLDAAGLAAIAVAAGRCARPVRLRGWRTVADAVTGEVISAVRSEEQPGGCLLVPCGNRRAAVCPPCAWLYKGDVWQVLIAGLRGGHGIPDDVGSHPAVFVTLTAPGFGLVHRGPGRDGQLVRCRPRRDKPVCEHGQPASCGRTHRDGEPVIGQPLCMECFGYHAAVLFNASVPRLWDQTARALPTALCRELGITRAVLRQHLRLSFGKVIEYQARGLIHVHAVFRADGAEGPGDVPPPWASADLLRTAVLAAAGVPSVTLPDPDDDGSMLTLGWGDQIDVRVVRRGIGGELDDAKVAAYIAKYASKATEDAGGIPVRIRSAADLEDWDVSPHGRRLIAACWQLGCRQEYAGLKLARWAHQYGYGGHFSTRSRRYSVTLASRRQQRQAWHDSQKEGPGGQVIVLAEWHYAGTGHPPDPPRS
jgi:hypothetical protein